MTVLDIGLLGLDTSHGEAFAAVLADRPDATVAGVWDGGDVRDAAYTAEFCERHGATPHQNPAALCDAVDAAMVLTANWDTHRSLAVAALDAGVPAFVDKPLAGRLEDVEALAAAAKSTLIFGGSAVPFHPALADVPVGETDRRLYCVGYDDPFYYGVHLADTARVLAGADWRAVAPSEEPGDVVGVKFENGTRATLRLDGPDGGTFGVLDASDRIRARALTNDPDAWDAMYAAFVEAFLDHVRGERDETTRVIDGATLLLGMSAALSTREKVTPESEALRSVHADGSAFLETYRPYY